MEIRKRGWPVDNSGHLWSNQTKPRYVDAHTTSSAASVFPVTFRQKPRLPNSEGRKIIIMQSATLSQKPRSKENGASGRPHRLVGQPRYPETRYLPLDAERRMVGAVRFASHIGKSINTLLTINAAHLQRMGSGGIFDIGHLWDGYRAFLEVLRKWITHRGITWSCIWVREYTGGRNRHHGEHWHIALHLPPRHQDDLAAQVAIWTGEAVGTNDGKAKCIARSENSAWYLNRRKENAGEYLGKATPKTRLRYGKRVPNDLRMTRHHGGEGPIQGKRYGISRPIGDTAQRRKGWQ